MTMRSVTDVLTEICQGEELESSGLTHVQGTKVMCGPGRLSGGARVKSPLRLEDVLFIANLWI